MGTFWILASFGLGQAIRLASNIALATLLYEEAFALMAIVMAVSVGLSMFSDIGLQANVVQSSRGDDPDFINTAWTIQVIRGVCLFVIAAVMAFPLSRFYGSNDPMALELLYLLPLIAFVSLIQGFQSAQHMTAARHLRVKEVALIEFVVGLFNALIMLTLAWYMRSVYAIAFALIISAVLHVALGYLILGGPRPHFRWESAALRSIVSFGKWIFLSTIISFLAMQLDRLALARMFPLAEVGVYSIAASLAIIVPTVVGRLQSGLLFPWYTRMVDSGMHIAVAFERTRMGMAVTASFLCVALISGAGSFFELAYDSQYAKGGVLLSILAFAAWFSCIEIMYGATFLAVGRPQWVALANVLKVGSFSLGLFAVSYFQLDITSAAICLVISEVLRWLGCLLIGRRLGLKNGLREAGLLMFFAFASFSTWCLVELWPVISELHPLWRLTVLAFLISLLFAPLFYRYVIPLVRPLHTG